MVIYLEMALGVKEQILRFDVTVGNALAMKVFHTAQNLFETAFDLAWTHPPKKR